MALFAVFVGLALFSAVLFGPFAPELSAFTLGLLGFILFGNRLIFGFSYIANAASSLLRGESVSRESLESKAPKEITLKEAGGIFELLVVWRSSLEPFKYTYYFAFFFLLLFSIMFELNILSAVMVAPIVEALTLGAAVPTVLIWGLSLLADTYLLRAEEVIIKGQVSEGEARDGTKG